MPENTTSNTKPKGLVSLCHHVAWIAPHNFSTRSKEKATVFPKEDELKEVLTSFGVPPEGPAGKLVQRISSISVPARADKGANPNSALRKQMKSLGGELWALCPGELAALPELKEPPTPGSRVLDNNPDMLNPGVLKSEGNAGPIDVSAWFLLDFV